MKIRSLVWVLLALPLFAQVKNPVDIVAATDRSEADRKKDSIRKPAELLHDFNQISHMYAKEKVKKSVEQHVELKATAVNLKAEVKRAIKATGADEEILQVLKRLGKL